MVGKVAGPKDPCKMVQAIFFWLGIGTLLPWNMFITVGLFPPPHFKHPLALRSLASFQVILQTKMALSDSQWYP